MSQSIFSNRQSACCKRRSEKGVRSLFLECRKWGCNKWGFKGCLPFRSGNRPKSAFFALFRRARRAPGKSRKREKKAFFLRYPRISLNPHLLNPHLWHSDFFVFGTLSVTFWSLFLMLLSLFSSLFCQAPFAGLLLRRGEAKAMTEEVRVMRGPQAEAWNQAVLEEIASFKAYHWFLAEKKHRAPLMFALFLDLAGAADQCLATTPLREEAFCMLLVSQRPLTVLVLRSWVLVTPHLQSFVQEPQSVPLA